MKKQTTMILAFAAILGLAGVSTAQAGDYNRYGYERGYHHGYKDAKRKHHREHKRKHAREYYRSKHRDYYGYKYDHRDYGYHDHKRYRSCKLRHDHGHHGSHSGSHISLSLHNDDVNVGFRYHDIGLRF